MGKQSVIIVATFVFLVSFAFAQEGENIGQGGQTMQTGVDRIKNSLDTLTKQLNLTPEQQTQIKGVLTNEKEELAEFLKEAKAKGQEIRTKAHNEINAFLTTEQKAKFEEMTTKHKAKVKEMMRKKREAASSRGQ